MIAQQQQNGVLTLTLNRPEKKNALNLAMYRALTAALTAARDDEQIKVVVLQGSASCFSSGNDLQDFLSAGEVNDAHPVAAFLYCIAAFPKPVLAAVAGLAIGIGTTVLLHCDLVYAAPASRLQLPFTQLGLCPEAASSLLLPQRIGYQRAAELLLLGEPFSSEQALTYGLINAIIAADALLEFVQQKALQLAALPTAAVIQSKTLMKAPLQAQVASVIAAELTDFSALLQSEACQQRLQAFFQRK